MRWRIASGAKVVDGIHEAAAEEMHPDAIYRNAGGQRIGGIEQPMRQIEPVCPAAARRERVKEGKSAGLNFFAFAQKIAANVNVSRAWFIGFGQDRGLGTGQLRLLL